MRLPEGRNGKLLALGILALMLLLGYAALVSPLLQLHADREEEISQLRERLERLHKVAAELPQLRTTLSEAKKDSAPHDLLLVGESEAVAGANLQSMVKDIFTAAGTEMTSAESLPSSVQGGFRRIGIRTIVVADYDIVVNVLKAVADARPLLFVDNVEIHTEEMDIGRTVPNKSWTLNVALEIYGYRASGS